MRPIGAACLFLARQLVDTFLPTEFGRLVSVAIAVLVAIVWRLFAVERLSRKRHFGISTTSVCQSCLVVLRVFRERVRESKCLEGQECFA